MSAERSKWCSIAASSSSRWSFSPAETIWYVASASRAWRVVACTSAGDVPGGQRIDGRRSRASAGTVVTSIAPARRAYSM